MAHARGLYGDRIATIRAAPGDAPIVDGVANLLLSERALQSGEPTTLAPEVLRLIRPAGGLLLGSTPSTNTDEIIMRPLPGDFPAWRRDSLPGAADWTHPYANPANTAASDETLVTGLTALQWFGGPGPGRMVDRHLRTTAPLARDGRMFIPANDLVIGVDAYNGIELWQTSLPGFTRTGAPYDGGWWAVNEAGIFAATDNTAVLLDPTNGAIDREYPLPEGHGIDGQTEWGWLALDAGMLLGSAAEAGAARREQSRDPRATPCRRGRSPRLPATAVFHVL